MASSSFILDSCSPSFIPSKTLVIIDLYIHDLLWQVNLADAAARKTALKEEWSREIEIAKAMQVAIVFTHTSLASTPAYSQFLLNMAEGAKTHGPIGAGRFSELPIRVAGMSAPVNMSY